MNENIDLTEILKNCPKGWKFYSSIYGEVEFVEILPNITPFPVIFKEHDSIHGVSIAGEHFKGKGECTFFPSREQRDWSKFIAPWYKKEKFDPKTLQPFDRVIVKPDNGNWHCSILSHREEHSSYYRMVNGYGYPYIVPYNEETKQLLGTNEEAPEYYKYWED